MFSLVFYAYGAPDFILLLVGSCVANFYLVKLMHKTEKKLSEFKREAKNGPITFANNWEKAEDQCIKVAEDKLMFVKSGAW